MPDDFTWLICTKCEAVFHLCILLPAEASVVTAAMAKTKCPGCGIGPKGLGIPCPTDKRAIAFGKLPEPGGGLKTWWEIGERGASSECMARIAGGSNVTDRHGFINYPHDPDDLNRCIKLVKVAPEVRKAFPEIAAAHPCWKVIIEHWDELVKMFHEEAGEDWSKRVAAGKTYDRMQRLFKGAAL